MQSVGRSGEPGDPVRGQFAQGDPAARQAIAAPRLLADRTGRNP
jgi:hypothetical protein